MMKTYQTIRSSSKTAMAFAGVLVAFFLFFQQPNSYQASTEKAHKEQKTDKKEDSKQAQFQVMTYQVLIPVLQINLFHSFDLLVEVPGPQVNNFPKPHFTDKVFHNFFQTLFRKIISPNAP